MGIRLKVEEYISVFCMKILRWGKGIHMIPTKLNGG